MNQTMNPTPTQSYSMASARMLLSLIFVLSGLSKVAALEGTQAYMQSVGLPGMLLWPTIAFEVGAGLIVILGYRTRFFAVLLAGFCVLSAVLFHHNFGDQMQMFMFLKNLSMAGGFLLLAGVGAGPFSLDGRAAVQQSVVRF